MKIATIIDWILTEKCNLNCYYCLQNADTRMAKCTPVDYRFAQKAEFPMLFHLTGGEPFLVPNLINLINELQAMGHYVSMNTNLTHSTRDFSKLVGKEHFLFINSSYHYIYRKGLINPFIRNYMYLREAGIFTYATIVMLSDLFDDLLSVADKLISNGVCVLPKLMRGREMVNNIHKTMITRSSKGCQLYLTNPKPIFPLRINPIWIRLAYIM